MTESEKELTDKYWDKAMKHFDPKIVKELFGTKENPSNRAMNIMEKVASMDRAASNSGGNL